MKQTRNLSLAVMLALLTACGSANDTTQPRWQPMYEAVYASGTVQPYKAYEVFTSTPAIVDEVLVEEGDTVRRGQVLIRLRSDQPDIQVADASERYQRARERVAPGSPQLGELEENVRLAEVAFVRDSTDWVRYQRLWEQNAIDERSYEQALRRFESSQLSLQAARERLRSTQDQLESELEASRRTYELQASRAGDYLVRAQFDGRVYRRLIEPGEYVSVNQPLLRLGSANKYVLELIVDESDINRVAIGQQATVRLENYPDDSLFQARISRIYPELDPQTNAFRLDAALLPPLPKLFVGTSVEVNIRIAEKDRALVIPREYLLPGDSIQTKNGRSAVRVGLRNLAFVEILSGADEQTTLYLPAE